MIPILEAKYGRYYYGRYVEMPNEREREELSREISGLVHEQKELEAELARISREKKGEIKTIKDSITLKDYIYYHGITYSNVVKRTPTGWVDTVRGVEIVPENLQLDGEASAPQRNLPGFSSAGDWESDYQRHMEIKKVEREAKELIENWPTVETTKATLSVGNRAVVLPDKPPAQILAEIEGLPTEREPEMDKKKKNRQMDTPNQ